MTNRRGKKEGTIYKRKNGTWRAQVSIEGNRLSYTGSSFAECRRWLLEKQKQFESGLNYSATQITYIAYLNDWLSTIRANLRDGTWRQYRQVVRQYIDPELGRIKISELRPDQIQRLYDRLISVGKGRRTVQVVHAVIHRSLNQALKLGIISLNPAAAATPPKLQQKEMKILDQGQVHKLLIAAEARGVKYLAFYFVALATGMRQGELLGLKWDDVEFQNQTLKVVRQSQPVPGGGFTFSQPKTKKGNRTIKFGKETAELLKRHYIKQLEEREGVGESWKEFGLVFPSQVGTPQNPPNVVRSFKSLLAAAGLPKVRFHDLRHTAASLMLNNGVDVLVVSRRLGHSKASVTLDIYGHMIPSSQERAAELMEELITPIRTALFAPTAPDLHQEALSN